MIYWISYKIHWDGDASDYTKKHDELEDYICSLGKFFHKTTSFIIFESDCSIDAICANLNTIVNRDVDIVIVSEAPDAISRIIGTSQDHADLIAFFSSCEKR